MFKILKPIINIRFRFIKKIPLNGQNMCRVNKLRVIRNLWFFQLRVFVSAYMKHKCDIYDYKIHIQQLDLTNIYCPIDNVYIYQADFYPKISKWIRNDCREIAILSIKCIYCDCVYYLFMH